MTKIAQTVRYELANMADIGDMVSLLAQLFSIEHDFSVDPDKQAKGLSLLLQNPQTACIQVARNPANEVIGMVSVQLVVSTAEGCASAWIEDMVVAAHYRGLGIGKVLMQRALTWAKAHGASRAQLLVDSENTDAHGYYTHIGWASTQLQARRIFL